MWVMSHQAVNWIFTRGKAAAHCLASKQVFVTPEWPHPQPGPASVLDISEMENKKKAALFHYFFH